MKVCFICRVGHTSICCCPKRKRQTGKASVMAWGERFV